MCLSIGGAQFCDADAMVEAAFALRMFIGRVRFHHLPAENN